MENKISQKKEQRNKKFSTVKIGIKKWNFSILGDILSCLKLSADGTNSVV